MIVFKTFLKVLNKMKVPIIMYTVILVFFAGFNMKTNDTSLDFVATLPDVYIVNYDEKVGVTKNLIDYIQNNSNIIDIKSDDDAINDALFYRDINYVIYIPKGYREDFLAGKNPQINVKSTGDYQAELAKMLLERYIKVANIYQKSFQEEDLIIENINKTLDIQTDVIVASTLDTNSLSRVAFYYNFLNYSILAGCVYVVCLILSVFHHEKIKKRTIISSMSDRKYNRILLLANSLFVIVLWIFYVLLSFLLLGNIMYSIHGVFYILNSFIFTLCSLTLAFFIGTLVNNKDAINGIVNIVSLGSSFLCGAFVPIEFLPDSVLKMAHILPSYWYIKSNELLKGIEHFSIESLNEVLFNMFVIIIFMILFIVMTNIVSYRKRKLT